MLERMAVGSVPRKHHIQLRGEDGKLRFEECLTREGFEGPYTIAYHLAEPHTQSLGPAKHGWKLPRAVEGRPLAKRHFRSQDLKPKGGAPIDARVPLLFNNDVVLSVLQPTAPDPVYFVNGDGDDLLFIFEGGGLLKSALGEVRFEKDDYLFIPKGLVHRLVPDAGVKQ